MSQASIGRWLAVAAGVVVIATVIAAIATMGLPSTQRDIRLDERRVRDLDRIVAAVRRHAGRHDALPPDLVTLAAQPGVRLSIADPVDGSPYAYQVTGERAFRLCAIFTTDTAKGPQAAGAMVDDEWLHGVGRQCFDRKHKDRSKGD